LKILLLSAIIKTIKVITSFQFVFVNHYIKKNALKKYKVNDPKGLKIIEMGNTNEKTSLTRRGSADSLSCCGRAASLCRRGSS
jgi:hypothetical protein